MALLTYRAPNERTMLGESISGFYVDEFSFMPAKDYVPMEVKLWLISK